MSTTATFKTTEEYLDYSTFFIIRCLEWCGKVDQTNVKIYLLKGWKNKLRPARKIRLLTLNVRLLHCSSKGPKSCDSPVCVKDIGKRFSFEKVTKSYFLIWHLCKLTTIRSSPGGLMFICRYLKVYLLICRL